MNDAALVAAMVAGDPRGLEGAYRAYSAPLLAYCRWLLPDDASAADAVHDTFLLAGQRAGQLRDPQRLRAWLYAIAHNECRRQLRGRARSVSLDNASDAMAPEADPDAAVQGDQIRELVWSAANALNDGDREVFELMVRHDLSPAEIGAVLGVSVDHAHARLSRARAQLRRALGVLLVARTGRADCPALAGLLYGWNGVLTALLRKRIGRHIDGCPKCGARMRSELRPAALLASYATLPFLAAPSYLWSRIESSPLGGGPDMELEPTTGFPKPDRGDVRRERSGALTVALLVAAVLLVGSAVAVPILTRPEADDVAASTGPSGSAPIGIGSSNPPLVQPGSTTPTAAPPAADPTGDDSSQPASPTSTGRGPVAEPSVTVTATAVVVGNPCPHYLLVITAVQTGGAMGTATLHWSTGTGPAYSVGMSVTGDTAKGAVANLVAPTVTWWVVVVTVRGTTVVTAQRTSIRPC